ncbi:hypothetical protein O9H85_10630 [Paenibacillus filicis]|uniref:Uncharacterized protein n=1 Tax=Paenibacillus gyeongsangnamensis TaxID=3388067 RepID=A0ABT4Q7Q3_9BACL|nr:hypothetical protein [Paenibacillus filicis]MCZ8512863.1 hypothetical protein [Paenibacillus filicis]
MIASLIILGYALLLYWGLREIWKQRRISEAICYILLVGWCAYLSLAKLFHGPLITLVSLHRILLTPLGIWLKQWMEGGAGG